jgi:hypothetical protein
MKNNLIFTNLAEQPTEDVEIKLRTFIFEKLGIEHKIEIGNVHRCRLYGLSASFGVVRRESR